MILIFVTIYDDIEKDLFDVDFSHQEELRVVCRVCGKPYIQTDPLRVHLLMAHGLNQ